MRPNDPAGQHRLLALDPIAARSTYFVRLFGGVMARAMARDFHAVRITADGPPAADADRPIVVYANHPSWWDPAFMIVLATRLFGERPGFGPIDVTALSRYRFMSRIGLFGVQPESAAGGARFLRTSLRILADRRSMLWITPEGRFTDPRVRPLRLRPGLAHLARLAPPTDFVPLAIEYAFWTERKPEALCRFGTPIGTEAYAGLSTGNWAKLLEEGLGRTMDRLAGDVMARDPARFRTLVRGRAGVGGVYDLWRRLRASAGGERFRPEHGERFRVEPGGR